MSLADRVIYALEATPEQAAALRQLTGEALTARMREIMHANGLSQIEVQRRLYSIGSLWAGQQDTRNGAPAFAPLQAPSAIAVRHIVRTMAVTDSPRITTRLPPVRQPNPAPIAKIVCSPSAKTLKAIRRWEAVNRAPHALAAARWTRHARLG
jgi:hypothetical protein